MWLFVSRGRSTASLFLVLTLLPHSMGTCPAAGPVLLPGAVLQGCFPRGTGTSFGKKTLPDVIHAVFAAAAFPECTCFISWPSHLLLERSKVS